MDTYLRSQNRDELLTLKSYMKNVTIPVQGIAAKEASVDEEGSEVSAQAGIGDPAYWYCFVRAPFAVAAFGGVEIVDEETGIKLCGS